MKLLAISALASAVLASPKLRSLVEREDLAGANSTTWCYWGRPQSALIRDKIWIDGGVPIWNVLENGLPKPDTKSKQMIYYIDLKHPFNITSSTNFSSVIKSEDKLDGNNIAPNAENGHLLSNDYGFVIYGGMMQASNAIDFPAINWALAKDLFEKDPTPLENPGSWRVINMDGQVTRAIGAGAYVSVPSENLAFVFGGSRNENWNEVKRLGSRKNQASVLSNRLISTDLSTMKSEEWANTTLPSDIPARTAGEIVWIPTGKKGALVALGGTVMSYNETTADDKISTTKADGYESKNKKLMDNVHIYDIDGNKWYTQETTGDKPPGTAEFCTVVASSQDGSSHNIYAYGGYSGVSRSGYEMQSADGSGLPPSAYDTVYILSLPAFEWTKAYEPTTSSAGRRGHRCHRIADNQMMVIGGTATENMCLSEFVRVFNMNNLKFLDSYDPTVNDNYKVPSVVTKKIKGDEAGGATMKPANWDDSDLDTLMGDEYKGTVKNYWPYEKVTDEEEPTDSSNSPSGSSSSSNPSGLPSYVPPLLGAILGLLVVITILCGVLFWLRRRKNNMRRLQSDSAASTVVKKRQTWSWLMGTYGDEKPGDPWDPTPGTERSDPFDGSTAAGLTPAHERDNPLNEADAREQMIYELPNSMAAQELPVTQHGHGDEIRPAPRRQNSKRVTINETPQEMGENDLVSPISPRPS